MTLPLVMTAGHSSKAPRGLAREHVGVLDRIDKREIRDLLGKGWLTHDAMWFYHTYRELGIDRANALNKEALRSLAPVEMQRTKKVLGIHKDKIYTFDALRQFLLEALELILPDSTFNKMPFSSPSRGLLHWEWESGECFAYKGMKQIGIIDEYRCGVMCRIECWLEALGIPYEINPKIDRCLMHERGACTGDIRVLLKD
jgi:hypothetical protein